MSIMISRIFSRSYDVKRHVDKNIVFKIDLQRLQGQIPEKLKLFLKMFLQIYLKNLRMLTLLIRAMTDNFYQLEKLTFVNEYKIIV